MNDRKWLNGMRLAFVFLIITTVVVYAALTPKVDGLVVFSSASSAKVYFVSQKVEPGGTSTGSCELVPPAAGEFYFRMLETQAQETCLFSITVTADATNQAGVFVGPFINTDGALAGVAALEGQTSCGEALSPGASKVIPITFRADPDLAEGLSINGAVTIEFPDTMPVCPP